VHRLAAGLLLTAALAAGHPAPGAQEGALELQASRGGFRPQQLTLRRGEAVQLTLRSADGEHCFAIDALRIEKRIVPGRATRLELTPARAGVFEFYCCVETGAAARGERGRLTVVE
jgi:cytochrome c oxidase subunit 2